MTEHKRLVMVKWKDHTSLDNWVKAKDVKKLLTPAIIVSVGWLLEEDDECYYLFGSHNTEDGDVGDSRAILKGTVVEVRGIDAP